MHNNLRITRILKSLGELGFEHFQAPLVRFFLEETLVRKTLSSVKRSVLDYFLFAVRDKRERRKLVRFAFQHFEPKDKFVWCPRKIQKRFKKKSEKRQNSLSGSGENAANDEGHSRYKHKEGEAASEPKDKAVSELMDAKTEDDSESVMRVDPEHPSEEDHEPAPDAAPVQPPLNNGPSVDNGEMASLEPSSIEGQAGGKLPEVTQEAEKAAEVWSAVAGSPAGSGDGSRDEMDSPLGPADSQKELEETASGTKERTVTDSPKHKSPAAPETFPRPDCDHTEKSIQIEKHEKNGINCNQSNRSEKEEPMEIVTLSS